MPGNLQAAYVLRMLLAAGDLLLLAALVHRYTRLAGHAAWMDHTRCRQPADPLASSLDPAGSPSLVSFARMLCSAFISKGTCHLPHVP